MEVKDHDEKKGYFAVFFRSSFRFCFSKESLVCSIQFCFKMHPCAAIAIWTHDPSLNR